MQQPDPKTLSDMVLADRLQSYVRVRGGWPVPLAGMVFWLGVAGLGMMYPPPVQLNYAFLATGLIFPLAMALAAVFRNPFMKDRTAVGGVVVPALLSMLLFWPMVVVAAQDSSAVTALVIFAIGMSMHWPVIGWAYGRMPLFAAHSVIRALAVIALWLMLPAAQLFVAIPLAVAAVYLASVIAIFVDSGLVARRMAVKA
jgi:hypothetical protein